MNIILQKFNKKTINLTTYYTNKLYLSVFHGIFVFLFLNLFKPFKLNLLKDALFGYSLLMGFLTCIIPYLLLFFLEKVNYKKWYIGSLTILYLFFIILYSFILWKFSCFYKEITGLVKLSFFLFFKYSVILSIISILFFLVINEKINTYKSTKKTIFKIKKKELVTFYSENKKDKLPVNLNELIYISVSGNYVSFFIDAEKSVKELIFRSTLSNIEQQINNKSYIFRCHKSFIINTKHITSISGNARGYFLNFDKIPQRIPVSRSIDKKQLESLML